MKRKSVIVMTTLFCLLSAGIYAAEKDADGCKDHPLVPRMAGYFITGCSSDDANADVDIIKGDATETIHLKGKSMALLYKPQAELETKPGEDQVRGHFEKTAKELSGGLYGITYGQKWPVYKMSKDGKNFWVVLMLNSGEYYTGSFAYRIISRD